MQYEDRLKSRVVAEDGGVAFMIRLFVDSRLLSTVRGCEMRGFEGKIWVTCQFWQLCPSLSTIANRHMLMAWHGACRFHDKPSLAELPTNPA